MYTFGLIVALVWLLGGALVNVVIAIAPLKPETEKDGSVAACVRGVFVASSVGSLFAAVMVLLTLMNGY